MPSTDPQPQPLPPSPGPRARLGALGEQLAVDHLVAAGLTVLDRNWRTRHGELDVVARDGATLVFCEVKARGGTGYGVPAAAVTPLKQRRLRGLALQWLAVHDEHADDLRFDVVSVLVLPGRPAVVTHLRAAF